LKKVLDKLWHACGIMLTRISGL